MAIPIITECGPTPLYPALIAFGENRPCIALNFLVYILCVYNLI